MRPLPYFAALTLVSSACAAHSPAPAGHSAHGGHAPAEHGGGHGGHGHGGHGAHGPGHFSDPSQYVPAWNDPARDAWQKPEEIVAALRVSPGATVVDLGAGTGYLVPALSRAVGPTGAVVALDIEPAMLTFLQDAATRDGWTNVRTHAAAPDDPKLAPASVDAVVTLNTWHHIENRGAYAAKLLAAIKPGGSFVVVDFLKEQTDGFGPPLEMRLTAEDVAADLRAGGFEVEVVSETMPRHYVVRGRRPAGG
jgi:predicted methyltransferase